MVTRWSRSTSNFYTLIGQNLTGEFMRKNTPYAERKETGSDQLENEASWASFTRVRNMAAHGSVSSRLSQSLTEEDIPGASLQGRNPTALKTDELHFWLKCRGDPAKGLKTKAQLAKRLACVQPPLT